MTVDVPLPRNLFLFLNAGKNTGEIKRIKKFLLEISFLTEEV